MKHGLAIIGFGGMGNWHWENISKRLPQLPVKGVWDIREEAGKKAAENGLYAYSSLNELLQDPDIDLVTIAVPNNFHKPLAIDCLRAGKHVVCEKPVAMNAGELEEMIAAARECGRVFSVHQNRRWDRDYVMVREAIRTQRIGTPYFIESRVQGSRGAMFGWRSYRVNGGGMLLDWGVHLLDQVMDLIPSPVVSVDAHLQTVFSGEVDDNIKLFLRFESGVSVLLEMSTNCFVNLPRWHVSSTDGTLVITDWNCNGKIVRLREDAGQMAWEDDIVYTEAGPTRTMAPRPSYTIQEEALPDVHPDWGEYYQNILDAIENRAELIVKPEQCLRVMKVIDLLFESQKAGHGFACHI